MSAGYVTLGQIQERPQAACNHCDRRGQLRIGCLTTEHGQRLPVRELRPFVADCPRMMSARRIWARPPEIVAIVSTYARIAFLSPAATPRRSQRVQYERGKSSAENLKPL
jgi:hypothetical protein